MKKLALLLSACMLLFMAACTPEGQQSTGANTFTVNFLDGDTTLKSVTVNAGETAEEYTPEKEGHQFTGWYGTPNFSHKFDFAAPINENKSVYAQFSSSQFAVDTRDFYIVGAGKGDVLKESNWGAVLNDSHKLQRADKPDVNEYTITLDLFQGDEFQFAINDKWENQRGAGYLTETEKDGEEYFTYSAGIFDADVKKSNITVSKPGNYTLILTTHPWDDKYDTSHDYYSEETKENYNANDFDTITWVYNGEPTQSIELAVPDIYVKGNLITGWNHDTSDEYKMTENPDGTFTYTHEFFKGDEAIFYTLDKEAGGLGSLSIKPEHIDAAASTDKLKLDEKNIKFLENGTYTFTYNPETAMAVVAFDPTFNTTYEPGKDWFLVGSGASKLLIDSAWGNNITEDYRLTPVEGKEHTYAITTDLEVGDQFQIVANQSWASKHSYGNLVNPEKDGTVYFSDIENIRVDVAGNYTLTLELDAADFSQDKITWVRNGDVLEQADSGKGPFDIFMKCSANDWALSEKVTTADGAAKMKAHFTEGDAFCFIYFNAGVNAEDIDHKNPGSLVTFKEKGTSGDANANFSSKDKDFQCDVTGNYLITIDFTSGAPIIDFQAMAEVTQFDAIIKGSMTGWENANETASIDGVVEMTYTFAEGDEFGFSYYDETTTEKSGNWIGIDKLGSKGDANQDFNGENNYLCAKAGTYKIVIDLTSGEPAVDFYAN